METMHETNLSSLEIFAIKYFVSDQGLAQRKRILMEVGGVMRVSDSIAQTFKAKPVKTPVS